MIYNITITAVPYKAFLGLFSSTPVMGAVVARSLLL